MAQSALLEIIPGPNSALPSVARDVLAQSQAGRPVAQRSRHSDLRRGSEAARRHSDALRVYEAAVLPQGPRVHDAREEAGAGDELLRRKIKKRGAAEAAGGAARAEHAAFRLINC